MRRLVGSIILLNLLLPEFGCGTFQNLQAPPPPLERALECGGLVNGYCAPLGGVQRSVVIGGGGTVMGPVYLAKSALGMSDGVSTPSENAMGGLMLTGLGLLAIVDTPLSLAGDVVTLPVVLLRRAEHPWATWWGEAKASPEKEERPDGPEPGGR